MNSKSWKKLIQSRGRSFIFSTASPIPVVVAAHGKVWHSDSIINSLVVKKRGKRKKILLGNLHDTTH